MTETPSDKPKKSDVPFKPSVSSKDRRLLDAFVVPSTDAYLEGYQRAGDIIVANAHSDDLNPDNLFFPVAYVYRHHIELLLKELIRLGEHFGSIRAHSASPLEPCPICGHCQKEWHWRYEHNLYKLWDRVKDFLKSVWPDSPSSDLVAVEHVILEFNKLDRTGQSFRYPSNTNGAQSLQGAPERVDLKNLAAVVGAVSSFLYLAWTAIDNCDPGSF